MACPYWLLSSIFKILDEKLFLLIFSSISTFTLSGSLKRISLSKANFLYTQLKPLIRVFSKTLSKSASVGRAIQHLMLLRWTHTEKLLALLHVLGLYLNIPFKRSDLCSNISQSYCVVKVIDFVKFAQMRHF